jgi:hypothetical protein
VNPLARLIGWLRPRPKTAEELAAAREAEAIRGEMETIRVSQLSGAGENYQSGRGSRH